MMRMGINLHRPYELGIESAVIRIPHVECVLLGKGRTRTHPMLAHGLEISRVYFYSSLILKLSYYHKHILSMLFLVSHRVTSFK